MENPILLCMDVGGTKLEYRFVELTPRGRNIILAGRLLCAEFTAFHKTLHWLLAQIAQPVRHVCIAAAGPVHNESISFTNLDWHIDAKEIRSTFGLEKLILVNDLTAMMWSLQGLTGDDYLAVTPGHPHGSTRVVVAPGTGLGVGMSVGIGSAMVTLPSEGGHVSFAPRTRTEQDLLAHLGKEQQHISAENVCSGVGLGALFRFLTKDNPCPERVDYRALGPWLEQQVAEEGEYCAMARRTYALFFDILAEVCGNIAVTCLPGGGIYLAGGLMVKLSSFMDKEQFIARFLDRSVQQELLKSIPIFVINHKNPALAGCETLLSGELLK